MKVLLSLLLFLVVIPQQNSEKIIWNETQKLRWEDFRGTPSRSASFVASTNTGINFGYSYKIDNDDVYVEYAVESFFSRDKSWFVPGKVTRHILDHEQAHFDISELHARILRKKLDKKKFSKKVKFEIESIYRKVEKQRKAMQQKFDAESNHSRNEEEEYKWRKYIAKQLEDYDEWK
ncbi:MAG TPA: DUF922 domain-containing protein [Aequorivita sp.]|nr:DUF922 domain-containing protein [Aequorivita sp.]